MLAGTLWSLGGPLVRTIETADAWQILFVRSVAVALSVLAVLWWRYGGACLVEIRRAGWLAFVAGVLLGTAFCGFIFAVLHTTVANAVFVLSAAPFLTAILAWLVLREPVGRYTCFAIILVLIGVGIMVGGGISAGAWFGNLMALLTMAGISGFTVAVRRGRGGDMLPAVVWAGLLSALVAALMAPDLAISGHDAALSVGMGLAITVGMLLYTIGARTLPSAELTILALTEVVLGPVLVWLAFAEVPRGETLIGGAIVAIAIVGQAISGLRPKTPPYESR